MISTTAVPSRVAARAAETKSRRIEERAERLNLMFVNALRQALFAAKKGKTRHPYPEPRGPYSEVLRTHSRPLEKAGCMIAGLIEDGLDHEDARVLASVLTEWVDAEMCDTIPPLSQLTPRLAIENGEAIAALAVAAISPCRANIERAQIEAYQAHAVSVQSLQRLARDRRESQHAYAMGAR